MSLSKDRKRVTAVCVFAIAALLSVCVISTDVLKFSAADANVTINSAGTVEVSWSWDGSNDGSVDSGNSDTFAFPTDRKLDLKISMPGSGEIFAWVDGVPFHAPESEGLGICSLQIKSDSVITFTRESNTHTVSIRSNSATISWTGASDGSLARNQQTSFLVPDGTAMIFTPPQNTNNYYMKVNGSLEDLKKDKYDVTVNEEKVIDFYMDNSQFRIDASNTNGVSWTGAHTGSLNAGESVNIPVLSGETITFTITSPNGKTTFMFVNGTPMNHVPSNTYDVVSSNVKYVTFTSESSPSLVTMNSDTYNMISWSGANTGSLNPGGGPVSFYVPSGHDIYVSHGYADWVFVNDIPLNYKDYEQYIIPHQAINGNTNVIFKNDPDFVVLSVFKNYYTGDPMEEVAWTFGVPGDVSYLTQTWWDIYILRGYTVEFTTNYSGVETLDLWVDGKWQSAGMNHAVTAGSEMMMEASFVLRPMPMQGAINYYIPSFNDWRMGFQLLTFHAGQNALVDSPSNLDQGRIIVPFNSIFTSWNSSPDGAGNTYAVGQSVRLDQMQDNQLVLFMQYYTADIGIYFVNLPFMMQHGATYPTNLYLSEGDNLNDYLMNYNFQWMYQSYDGVSFDGIHLWYIDEWMNPQYAGRLENNHMLSPGSYMAIPMWFNQYRDGFTINYHSNIEGYDEVRSMQVSAWSQIFIEGHSIFSDIPDQSQFPFKGWSTDSNGNGQWYPSGANGMALPSNGWYGLLILDRFVYDQYMWEPYFPGFDCMNGFNQMPNLPGDSVIVFSGGNLELYAQWGPWESAEVTYDLNGGSGTAPATEIGRPGTPFTIPYPNDLTKENYVFKYWSSRPDGNGSVYYPGSIHRIPNSSIVLYAIWEGVDINVTFDPNGGGYNGPYPTATGKFGGTFEAHSGDGFFYNGFVFKGWSTTPGGGDVYLPGVSYGFPAGLGTDVTLYAQWTKSYTLYYDGNKGTGAPVPATADGAGNVTLSDVIPVRDGYDFTGWCFSREGEGQLYPSSGVVKIGRDMVIYAQWTAASAALTYYANGASGSPPAAVQSHTGEEIVLEGIAGMSNPGNRFAAWCTTADGTGTWYLEGEILTMPIGGLDLYAQWVTMEEYLLIYSGNGGDGAPLPHTMDPVDGATVSSTIPTRMGYTFDGWNTEADGKGLSFNSGDRINFTAANVTLYAQWKPNDSFVEYNRNDGSGYDETVYTATGEMIIVREGMGRNGYEFMGWCDSRDGKGTWYHPGNLLEVPPGGLVLYAQWTLNEQPLLIYDGNGGSGQPVPKIMDTTNGAVISMERPTRYGYTFSGWNTAADGTGVTYYPGTLIDFIGDHVTLYAQWAPLSAEVTYHHNDGTGMTTVVGCSTGDVLCILYGPARDGYVFKGWCTTADGTGLWYSADSNVSIPAYGMTLYAQWAEETGVQPGDDTTGDDAGGWSDDLTLLIIVTLIISVAFTAAVMGSWFRSKS